MPSEQFSNVSCLQLDDLQSTNTTHFMRSHNPLYFNHSQLSYDTATPKLYATEFLSPSSTANSVSTPQVESASQADLTPSRLPLNANLIMNFPSSKPDNPPEFNSCSISAIAQLEPEKGSLDMRSSLPFHKRRIIKLERSLKLNRLGAYTCRQCQQTFPKKLALYKHQWVHSRYWNEVKNIDLNHPEQFAILQAAHVLLEISGSKSLEE